MQDVSYHGQDGRILRCLWGSSMSFSTHLYGVDELTWYLSGILRSPICSLQMLHALVKPLALRMYVVTALARMLLSLTACVIKLCNVLTPP